MKRAVVSCAGLGMGNASRISAVLEELSKTSIDLTVTSWGNGYKFLLEYKRLKGMQFNLIQLHSYLGNFFLFPFAYIANTIRLWLIIRKVQPHLILLDSDYHFLAYFFKRSKIVFIGQAAEVEQMAKTVWLPTFSMRLNFLLREKMDKCVQFIFADRVFCPTFASQAATKKNSKFEKVPLIVRKDFLLPLASEKRPGKIGILRSGSRWDAARLKEIQKKNSDIVEWIQEPQDTRVTQPSDLAAYDAIICQGGMSAISECLAMKKFIIVFPIHNQAEPYINATKVQRIGLGALAGSLAEITSREFLHQALHAKMPDRATPDPMCLGAQVIVEKLKETHLS
jgi:UDP-N-acetylglucosamine:LPS N-acetylglucosamine transferase